VQTDCLSYKGTNLSLIADQWENEYNTNANGNVELFTNITRHICSSQINIIKSTDNMY